ncbi:hypothetical protein MHYP_G00156990 [Metynnis hypsauchen]
MPASHQHPAQETCAVLVHKKGSHSLQAANYQAKGHQRPQPLVTQHKRTCDPLHTFARQIIRHSLRNSWFAHTRLHALQTPWQPLLSTRCESSAERSG